MEDTKLDPGVKQEGEPDKADVPPEKVSTKVDALVLATLIISETVPQSKTITNTVTKRTNCKGFIIECFRLKYTQRNKIDPWEFFNNVLKKPKYILAPMVDQSELAFRMMVRKYGTHVCYTPMLHSTNFAKDKTYRKHFFSTCEGDRPLIVQVFLHFLILFSMTYNFHNKCYNNSAVMLYNFCINVMEYSFVAMIQWKC